MAVIQSDHEGFIPNTEKLKQIEDLLTGSGRSDFEKIEKRLRYFCPFEAIGMVRQEIRHAHFLCFLLDPNQTHPFGDLFLRTLLFEVASQFTMGEPAFSSLDLHFMSAPKAIVYRERWNIDIIVELPASSFEYLEKGLLLVIEMKIDAIESKHQLPNYYKRILEEYDEADWNYCFVFLTPNATEPSKLNSEIWTPVSLIDTIERFDANLETLPLNGRAVEIFRDYSSMIRRNFVDDEELARVAKRVWSKHRRALETLYDYWPDLLAEILEWIRENPQHLIQTVQKETGVQLRPDTHDSRILRYVVKDWLAIDGFCDGDQNWVESGAILVLEIRDWGEEGCIRASFVLGPSEEDLRNRLYDQVLNSVDNGNIKISRRTATPSNWKQLSVTNIQQKHTYEQAVEEDTPAENLAKDAIAKFAKFLSKNIMEYDKIVRNTFGVIDDDL